MTPPFITNRTLRSALMSRVGSPSTATRSASRPALIAPNRSPRCSTLAATEVAEREDADIAAVGDGDASVERFLEAGSLGFQKRRFWLVADAPAAIATHGL